MMLSTLILFSNAAAFLNLPTSFARTRTDHQLSGRNAVMTAPSSVPVGESRRDVVTTHRAPDPLAMCVSAPLKVIICGAPASGKGTQCELLRETYGLVHLSTGDMLRAAVAAETEVGAKAKGYMERGELVPDDVIIGIVKDRLSEHDCLEHGWLLDGFPRTEAQAQALEAVGIRPDKVLFLNVPDEILIERVVGRRLDPVTGRIYHLKFAPPENGEVEGRLTQRADDTEEKARVRLQAFHTHMSAVEKCYANCISYTDGTQSKDLVFGDLQKCLAGVAAGLDD